MLSVLSVESSHIRLCARPVDEAGSVGILCPVGTNPTLTASINMKLMIGHLLVGSTPDRPGPRLGYRNNKLCLDGVLEGSFSTEGVARSDLETNIDRRSRARR